ncbi:hypothetical protein [Nocardioides sp. LHG3406-4]|uniref:hypothetical protein n=1 Tax=Nocardioides sp. LHG3406-4 TaxID=2804575 RepID=UPI003CFB75F0
MAESQPVLANASTMVLSVHGPAGVVDLMVPGGVTAHDVAREYARQSGLTAIPLLQTALGQLIPADRLLTDAGVESGDVVVAATGFHRPRSSTRDAARSRAGEPGPLSAVGCTAAALAAALAGLFATTIESDTTRVAVAGGLLLTGLLATLPVGSHARHRVVAAPAFAAAAALAYVGPAGYQIPGIVAACALAAAVIAAVGRAWSPGSDEALTVWIVVSSVVASVTGLTVFTEFEPRVGWAILLTLAMLGARFAPVFAIDVPDHALIEMEKLAVTAWSARDGVTNRRGRMIVPESAMKKLVASGTRMITASAAAILVVVCISVPLLLQTAVVDVDRIGARCLVFFAGAAILAVARSYRHAAARALLRLAGLVCWAVFFVVILRIASPAQQAGIVAGAVTIGLVCVAAGVATGRGWRSVWWSRRAEVAEVMAGAFGIGAAVVASGLFRALWEMNS